MMKRLVLGEEDKSLNCLLNLNYLLYCNTVINTTVKVDAKVNSLLYFI